MDDDTWKGYMTTPDSIYEMPSLIFHDENIEEIQVTGNMTTGDLDISIVPSNVGIPFSLANFNQINQHQFSFDAIDGSQTITTFTVNSEEYASADEFKAMLIGAWRTNDIEERFTSAQKTTGVPVAFWVIQAVTVITVSVADHCTNVIEIARRNCNTPPCSFHAGICSADCHCPSN